jgi:hypothetical protein
MIHLLEDLAPGTKAKIFGDSMKGWKRNYFNGVAALAAMGRAGLIRSPGAPRPTPLQQCTATSRKTGPALSELASSRLEGLHSTRRIRRSEAAPSETRITGQGGTPSSAMAREVATSASWFASRERTSNKPLKPLY